MNEIWLDLLAALGSVLRFFHDITAGLFDGYAWTVAIVLLTVAVRLLLMPLAVRQFRSMQAMQELRPQMKKIQQRYKTDRGMMRTDPEKYRERRQKQQEEMMALYKEHNVNPAASCLPLVLQAPIFFALFRVLNDATLQISGDVISESPFYIIDQIGAAANSEIAGWSLVIAMIVTMFVSQKQMMARTQGEAEGIQAQQQKIMLYGMPVFLGFVAYRLPIGVLLYWVTTNLWQMGQQAVILREVAHDAEEDTRSRGADGAGKGRKPGGKPSGTPREEPGRRKRPDASGKGDGGRPDRGREGRSDNGGRPRDADGAEHLPRRKRRN